MITFWSSGISEGLTCCLDAGTKPVLRRLSAKFANFMGPRSQGSVTTLCLKGAFSESSWTTLAAIPRGSLGDRYAAREYTRFGLILFWVSLILRNILA